MRIIMISVCVLLTANIAFADLLNLEKARPAWGSITTCVSKDSDAVALYGEGVLSEGLGHGPGRCYTNEEKNIFLEFDIGVDDFVESITISKELQFPTEAIPPVSPLFDKLLNQMKEPCLGSTKDNVKKLWGIPSKEKPDEFIYILEGEEFRGVRVIFLKDKISSIQYYCGEPIDFYGDEYEVE